MKVLREIGVLVWKDLMIDLRRKENILAMFFFALLTLMIFYFALATEQSSQFRLTPLTLQTLTDNTPAKGQLTPAEALRLMPLSRRIYPTQSAFIEALNGAGAWSPEKRIALVQAARTNQIQASAPGMLWVTFLMAGVLGLSRSFAQERENECMDALLLTPVARGVLYLGKMCSNVLFLVIILAMLMPLFGLLFQAPLTQVALPLTGVMLGGVLGFSALGTLLGGLTAALKGKEVLLPLLLFPLLVPILIVSVHLTKVIFTGTPLAAEMNWIQLLVAFDAIYLIVSFLAFDFVVET